jgi:hypothetical protein
MHKNLGLFGLVEIRKNIKIFVFNIYLPAKNIIFVQVQLVIEKKSKNCQV